MSLVAAKCPNCGAGLKVETDRDVVTCGYCHTSAFVKTRHRPVTAEIARQHRVIIDTTGSRAVWLGLVITALLCAGVAAAFLVLRAPATTLALPPPPDAPATPSPAAPTAAAEPAPTAAAPPPSGAEPLASPKRATSASKPAVSVKPSQVRLGALTVSGRLSPSVVQPIVRQRVGRFRMCHEQALSRAPTLSGRVSARFVIGRDGNVSNVSNGGSDLPDSAMVSCVLSAFYGMTFPAPEGGIVTVVAPVLFSL